MKGSYKHKLIYLLKTDPKKKDTDGDGSSDGAELLYLEVYNSEGEGFFEATDHPNSTVVSLFARDIYAELGTIVDLQTEEMEVFKTNILKAETYKNDLLVYANRIMNYYSDLREEEREAFRIYLQEIRTFISALNQMIANKSLP